MQVENVTWVCFTTWRTFQQQGNLTVCPGLLGQIIKDDQSVFAAIQEVLTHRTTSVWSQELHCCRIGCTSGNDDGVIHSVVFFQLANNVRNRRLLLTYGNVDTLNARTFLVDDGVNGKSSLTSLTVTNDQLTLTTTDWYHGINSLVTGLHWLVYALTCNYTRSNALNRCTSLRFNWTFTVNRGTQSVDYTTQQGFAYRYFQNTASTLGSLAFSQTFVFTQNNRAYRVAFQVHRQAVYTAFKFNHLTVHGVGKTVDTNDTVGYGYNGALVLGL